LIPEIAWWIGLFGVVGTLLALDLFVLHRDERETTFKEAAAWSALWISTAVAFGILVTLARGGQSGTEYFAGYLIELSLSVDNVFVFAMLFAAFAVPPIYQHRLLFWGILGAVVFRALFITGGTALLGAAHWVIYLLGILLVITGIRMARTGGHEVDPERNPILRLFRRFVPTTDGLRGGAFIVRENGKRMATPLLAVLVAIETTDIMFALDSIPAVFAITTDAFIVFSSNLFAILGLRSLYFLLAGLIDRFVYLKLGLAALLVFAGGKILVSGVYHMPTAGSLAVIVCILAVSILASIIATHPRRDALILPAIRIGSGIALGLLGLGIVVVAAAARRGEDWLAWLVTAALIATAVMGVVAGASGLRHGRSSVLAEAMVRIGAGIVLGVGVMAVAMLATAVRGTDLALWIAIDVLAVTAVVSAVVAVHVALRALRARPAVVRLATVLGTLIALMTIVLVALE
jgi:tellurite resistance protein TerC